VVKSEDITYFLAGDTSYSEELLINNVPDGISPRAAKTLATMTKIRKLAIDTPLVYLPAHDHNSERRLIEKTPIYKAKEEAIPAA
jgi:glyoxylase-like metal-dependent hydrolase (beta-lactamase superfamily II)